MSRGLRGFNSHSLLLYVYNIAGTRVSDVIAFGMLRARKSSLLNTYLGTDCLCVRAASVGEKKSRGTPLCSSAVTAIALFITPLTHFFCFFFLFFDTAIGDRIILGERGSELELFDFVFLRR